MANLSIDGATPEQMTSSMWCASLLHALAREEAAGRQVPKLTESGMPTWNRFRGRLKGHDFIGLLFEDAAVQHPIPFDPKLLKALAGEDLALEQIPESLANQWLQGIEQLALGTDSQDYIQEMARFLGVPSRMARADLHVVKPHHKVLELPGTGGQLSHYLASTHPGLSLQENFTVACETWKELTLAGLVALDLRSTRTDFIVQAGPTELKQADHLLRQRTYDFVVGLNPDKGGVFKVQDQLAIWFPNATILLV